MTPTPLRYTLPFAALLMLSGCGDDDAATPAADRGGDAAETAASDVEPEARLRADDLDGMVRGIARENEMLSDIAARMAEAPDDARKLVLMTEVQPAKLEAAGAEAAGLDAETYRRLKDDLFTVVGQQEMRAMLEQQFAAVDTTGMDEATAEQARKNAEEMKAQLGDPFAELDAATADAIRARTAELAELRATHIGLLFKAAGG